MGLEPLLREKLDPKSSASTNSATPAFLERQRYNFSWKYTLIKTSIARFLPLCVIARRNDEAIQRRKHIVWTASFLAVTGSDQFLTSRASLNALPMSMNASTSSMMAIPGRMAK